MSGDFYQAAKMDSQFCFSIISPRVLLEDEYRVWVVRQTCRGEGEAVVAHRDAEPLK